MFFLKLDFLKFDILKHDPKSTRQHLQNREYSLQNGNILVRRLMASLFSICLWYFFEYS